MIDYQLFLEVVVNAIVAKMIQQAEPANKYNINRGCRQRSIVVYLSNNLVDFCDEQSNKKRETIADALATPGTGSDFLFTDLKQLCLHDGGAARPSGKQSHILWVAILPGFALWPWTLAATIQLKAFTVAYPTIHSDGRLNGCGARSVVREEAVILCCRHELELGDKRCVDVLAKHVLCSYTQLVLPLVAAGNSSNAEGLRFEEARAHEKFAHIGNEAVHLVLCGGFEESLHGLESWGRRITQPVGVAEGNEETEYVASLGHDYNGEPVDRLGFRDIGRLRKGKHAFEKG
jgi:hypothetical protein